MFKVAFCVLAIFIGGIYYFKEKGFDVQRDWGSSAFIKKTPTPAPTPTPIIKNRYVAGQCLKTEATGLGYIKIAGFDGNTNFYTYYFCKQYKGCDTEAQHENFNFIDQKYQPSSLFNCPAIIK